jgi:proteasome beta subunit
MSEPKALETGTTTVGIMAKDAVIIAADSKSTMGYMVESKLARKIFQLDDHIGITIAGMVGDAQTIVRLLKAQFKLYRLERGPISVKAASTLLSNILQGSKYFPYMNQFIMAGYDSNGPAVYTFDPYGGSDSHDKFFSTGSGSPFVYGMLESNYKEGMDANDAVALAVKAVRSAIERDIGSGGRMIIVAVIDKDGYRELSPSDIKKYV